MKILESSKQFFQSDLKEGIQLSFMNGSKKDEPLTKQLEQEF